MRTHDWNKAIPVAEAGIEEAFTHLKDDVANLETNGWSSKQFDGKPAYTKRRDFTSDGSHCLVMISNPAVSPVVYSQAYVPGPLGRGDLVRTVKVTCTPRGRGAPGGITVKNAINLGSDFWIDSYDSTDPNKSVGGRPDPLDPTKWIDGKYPDPLYANRRQPNGNLASMSATPGQLMLADSKIFGHLYTTATGGYTGPGTHGMVGDQAFQSNVANESHIQDGYYSNDLNITIPNVAEPAGWQTFTPALSIPQTINGVTYDYVLNTGNWQLPLGTTLQGKILIQGPDVVLYIPSSGRIQFGSGDTINIDSSNNASFKMYNASNRNVVMKDVSNDSGVPARFTYYGLPSTAGTRLTMTGSGAFAFAGLIDAPNQDITLTGSNGGNQDFVGAIIANGFTMSGHSYMHVDESLLQGGGGSIPVINSYAEISPINFPQ
jgi:hypothetical protein